MKRKKKFIVICCLGIMIAIMGSIGGNQVAAEKVIRKMKVSYQAQQKFKPQVAVVDLAVETKGENLNSTYQDNSQRTQKVKRRLKTAPGVRIISADYRVKLEESRLGKEKIAQYLVQNRIKIRTANLDRLGKIIEISIRAGVNRVATINYKLADYRKAYKQVTRQALQGFKQKAEFIAEEMEVKLGSVLHLQVDQNNYYHQLAAHRETRMLAAKDSTQPVISPEKIKIEVNVRGTYRLK